MAEVFGVVLDGVGELHDGGHLLDGEVGDGAEVAAVEALGGFAEGGVGLNAESCWRLGRGEIVGVGGFVVHHDGFATHGIFLLPALRRRMLQLKISSNALMAVSTCLRSRMKGGRKRRTVSLVRLMMMRRSMHLGGDLLGEVGGVELEAEHEADAADVGDAVVACGES